MEENILDLIDSHTMHFAGSHSFTAFNNLTSGGARVALYEDVSRDGVGPWVKRDGIEDRVGEALTLSLL